MTPVSPHLTPRSVRAFLTSEHVEWSGRCAELVTRYLTPRTHPASDAEGRKEAKALLAILGDTGLLAPIGEGDLRGCCLAREAVAWASPLADAVWALQGLGITPLLRAGTEAQRERWVPDALAGRCMTAFAMTEPGAGSDVAAMTTRAVRDGAHWVLDGHKWLISNAGIADLYVVFASTDAEAGSRGITAFLVPADTPGCRFAGPQVMSAPHPLGEMVFEGCRVPDSARLGDEGGGFKVGMAALDQVGAAAVGMAARALDEAVSHALSRRQFGKPLADLPTIREKLGRCATELDAARLLVLRAAFEKDGGADRITREAAMAKAFATEAAQGIVDEAVQVVGGIGVLAEHPVELLYRSIRALRIYEGTTEIQHMIIAGTLLSAARAAGGDP
ncbi:MAG: acyl-CoA dehydrogenase family protein [Gemmatimonadota bacterium]